MRPFYHMISILIGMSRERWVGEFGGVRVCFVMGGRECVAVHWRFVNASTASSSMAMHGLQSEFEAAFKCLSAVLAGLQPVDDAQLLYRTAAGGAAPTTNRKYAEIHEASTSLHM